MNQVTQSDSSAKVYFPGLNGLRFFAAFAVIVTHIELIKGSFGFANLWKHPVFFNLGGLGVYFFFVLSGFLITYLLFTEKSRSNSVAVRKFYYRRIFRIWPLYYLIMIIGFFVLPFFEIIDISYLKTGFQENFWSNFWLYLTILPNLAFSLYEAVPHIGQTWSIGVEEQFYLIWPLLIKYAKKPLRLLIGLIVGLVAIKAIVLFFSLSYPDVYQLQVLKKFLAMSKIECMAVGGLGAYVLFYNKEMLLKLVLNHFAHIISWIMIPVLIFYTPDMIQDGIHLVYSLFFIVIILNISSSPKTFIKLENSVFNFLGNISYGIYMFHLMVIPLVLILMKNYINEYINPSFFNAIVYFLVITLTILISFLSHKYFESPFLKYKKKHTIIKSGSNK